MRPQRPNPFCGARHYRLPPEQLRSTDGLKRLGFVFDYSEDRQAAAAILLPLFTCARLSEITGLRRN